MKKIIWCSIALFCSVFVYGQSDQQGIMVYAETFYMSGIKKPEGMEEQQWETIVARMPESRTRNKELHFDVHKTLYKAQKDTAAEQLEYNAGRGRGRGRRWGRNNQVILIDLDKKEMVVEENLMGKPFVVEDTVAARKWKITGQQKTILGYPCMEAVLQDTSQKVSAWFTVAIPISAGPRKMGGLPGLIMELSLRDGAMVITAKEFLPDAFDPAVFERDPEGKRMSAEQYNKMAEEKREEFRQMNRGRVPGRPR